MNTRERLYSIYHNMKSRCYLPTFSRYEFYGGRGITICDEWLNSFQSFYDWAINNGYDSNLLLGRIDINGDYEPNNCRWVDRSVQNNNTRKNHYYTYNGETKSIAAWAKQYKIHRCVLNNRLRRGWTFEDAIKEPTRNYRDYLNN